MNVLDMIVISVAQFNVNFVLMVGPSYTHNRLVHATFYEFKLAQRILRNALRAEWFGK